MNVIDRRLNPQGKSLANRQRFLKRAKEQIVKAVRDASAKRNIQDIEGGDKIAIPTGGVREPSFHHADRGGIRDYVVPGNKDYTEGTTIPRPQGGGGGRGSEGSADGEGDDDFRFVLSKDEFLDIFFDDLELPDLIKKRLRDTASVSPVRAGYARQGSPSSLAVVRTMRNSLSRRIALKRPRPQDIEALEQEIDAVMRGDEDPERLDTLRQQLALLVTRSQRIPFIDPIDVRYNRFEMVPQPVTQAVMFCLMDVSGSMTEHMKDLAKRFFMLLYLFLKRRYRHVEVVFIRHTHQAREVDEQTFFFSTETGGTVVSTALVEMQRIASERFDVDKWNIYAAQASDGDNTTSDNIHALNLLERDILPLCQYYSYIEVAAEYEDGFGRETELWRTYKRLAKSSLPLAMRRVRNRSEIFPVFRDLFSTQKVAG
ncbi:MAG: YeaH/YhbH family protein [Azospirillaceae bacterium]|nr:YeaH/YhbH family protein [Azospirillaceae bacterium]